MPTDRADPGKAVTELIDEVGSRSRNVLLQDRDEQYWLYFGRVRSGA